MTQLEQILELVQEQQEEINNLKSIIANMQRYADMKLQDRREYARKAEARNQTYSKYTDLLFFNKLPLEVRLKVLAHLDSYDTARVDYWKSTNKYEVTSDVCLYGSDYEKPKTIAEFHKGQFDKEALKIANLLEFGEQSWSGGDL